MFTTRIKILRLILLNFLGIAFTGTPALAGTFASLCNDSTLPASQRQTVNLLRELVFETPGHRASCEQTEAYWSGKTNLVALNHTFTSGDLVDHFVDLKPLLAFPNLQSVTLNGFYKGTHDIGVLAQLPNLKELTIELDHAVDLSDFGNAVELQVLNLRINGISQDQDFVAQTLLSARRLKGLKKVSVGKTWSLQSLSKFKELNSLHLSNIMQSAIDTIPADLPITELTLQGSSDDISDISHIGELIQLRSLTVQGLRGGGSGRPLTLNGLGLLQRLELDETDASRIAFESWQTATNLTDLSLTGSNITTLQFLSSASKLESLNIVPDSENGLGRLTSLRGLEGAVRLKTLTIVAQPLEDGLGSPVLAPLQMLKSLASVNLSRDRLIQIDSLANHPGLKALDVSDNALDSIDPLASDVALIELKAQRNQISDASVIERLTALTTLRLDRNELVDISFASRQGLFSDPGLKRLDLCYNRIRSVAPLSGRSDLQDIILDINEISDVSPLKDLPQTLGILSLRENLLSDVAVLRNLRIGFVAYLEGNPLGNSFVCPFPAVGSAIGCDLKSHPFPYYGW